MNKKHALTVFLCIVGIILLIVFLHSEKKPNIQSRIVLSENTFTLSAGEEIYVLDVDNGHALLAVTRVSHTDGVASVTDRVILYNFEGDTTLAEMPCSNDSLVNSGVIFNDFFCFLEATPAESYNPTYTLVKVQDGQQKHIFSREASGGLEATPNLAKLSGNRIAFSFADDATDCFGVEIIEPDGRSYSYMSFKGIRQHMLWSRLYSNGQTLVYWTIPQNGSQDSVLYFGNGIDPYTPLTLPYGTLMNHYAITKDYFVLSAAKDTPTAYQQELFVWQLTGEFVEKVTADSPLYRMQGFQNFAIGINAGSLYWIDPTERNIQLHKLSPDEFPEGWTVLSAYESEGDLYCFVYGGNFVDVLVEISFE